MDYEAALRQQKPNITWQICDSSKCRLENYISKKGTIQVPHDHENPSSPKITISFQRFTKKDRPSKYHVIFLAGGPGRLGRSTDGKISMMLRQFGDNDVACYSIDHRGMGDSSKFTNMDEKYMDYKDHIESIIKNGPFPVKFLTTHQASLDVSALAIAISNELDYDTNSTFHLMGGSYGGLWGNQVVRLTPNLFYSAYLSAVPRMRDAIPSSAIGLAENCAMDSFCRRKIGGNVMLELRKSIKTILNFKANECTQMFADMLDFYKETDDYGRLIILADTLQPLISGNIDIGDYINSVQLVLVFLKATSDCLHPTRYDNEVLSVVKQGMNSLYFRSGDRSVRSFNRRKSDESSLLNVFVNTLGFIDSDFYPGAPSLTPKNLDDIHEDIGTFELYSPRQKLLQKYLKGMVHTENYPLKTIKTHIYMEQGRIDLNTDYRPAYATFESIRAPFKVWILYDHSGHSYSTKDKCLHDRLAEFLNIRKDSNGESCVYLRNKSKRLDWTFSHYSKLIKLWEHIKTAPNEIAASIQVGSIPNYQKITSSMTLVGKEPPKYHKSTTAWSLEDLSRSSIFIVAGFGITLISIVSIFTYLIYRNHSFANSLGNDNSQIQV